MLASQILKITTGETHDTYSNPDRVRRGKAGAQARRGMTPEAGGAICRKGAAGLWEQRSVEGESKEVRETTSKGDPSA
jgi:hypothetical protein